MQGAGIGYSLTPAGENDAGAGRTHPGGLVLGIQFAGGTERWRGPGAVLARSASAALLPGTFLLLFTNPL